MTPELSRIIRIDELPAKGREITISAEPPELQALADRFGLPHITSLEADLRIRHRKGPGILEIRGQIRAALSYTCILSLEPFDATHEIEVAERLVQSSGSDGIDKGDFDAMIAAGQDDLPEVINGNNVDLGELVAETLAVNLEPYPRKPGAESDIPEEADMPEFTLKDNPFGALKSVKLPDEQS